MTTVIGTSFLAALSGIDSFSGMADFVELHLETLKDYFEFPCDAPSYDTYQRFGDALNPDQFLASFHFFTQILADPMQVQTISIDGKTIRNSGNSKPFHIVCAWCHNRFCEPKF